MGTSRDFAFEVDRDITKLVTASRAGRQTTISVRLAADTVIETRELNFTHNGQLRLEPDETGLTVHWRAPLIPWASWPTIARRVRV